MPKITPENGSYDQNIHIFRIIWRPYFEVL